MKPPADDPEPTSAEETGARSKRFEPTPAEWDDRAFRQRMTDYAKRQRKTVRQVLEEIGLTRDFAYRPADTRSTKLVARVAKALDVSPAILAGWAPPEPQMGAQVSELISKLIHDFSEERLKMLVVALAMTRRDLDPAAIAELVKLVRFDWTEKLNGNN